MVKNKKLLLTIQNLKDLGILKTKKKRRRIRNKKLNKVYINPYTGIRSDSSGMTGFGEQINRTNDLQNEKIRLENARIENNSDNKLKELTDMTTLTRNQLGHLQLQAQDYVSKTTPLLSKLYRNDGIYVSQSGGSEFFDAMGTANNSKGDQHPNENIVTYIENIDGVEVKKQKYPSQMNQDELKALYTYQGGTDDVSLLTRKEIINKIRALQGKTPSKPKIKVKGKK